MCKNLRMSSNHTFKPVESSGNLSQRYIWREAGRSDLAQMIGNPSIVVGMVTPHVVAIHPAFPVIPTTQLPMFAKLFDDIEIVIDRHPYGLE